MRLTLLLALLLAALGTAGCQQEWYDGVADFTPKPDQAQAVTMVWTDYGVADLYHPPEIGWINTPNCTEADGALGFMAEGGCWEGDTYIASEVWTIILIAEPKMYETAIAHELCHAANYVKTGSGDPNHLGPCFQPNGGLVAIEADKLREDGL